MPRRRVAAHETQAVGRDELPFLDRYRGAFRVADLRAERESRLFAAAREVDRGFDRKQPGMVEVETGQASGVGRQEAGVGQSGAGIGGGEAGDVQGGIDRFAQGRRGKVRGARLTLPLVEIDADRDRFVAVVLDGFDFAAAHRHRLPEAVRDIDLAGAGSLLCGVNENVAGEFLQGLEAVAEARCGRWDGSGGWTGHGGDGWRQKPLS